MTDFILHAFYLNKKRKEHLEKGGEYYGLELELGSTQAQESADGMETECLIRTVNWFLAMPPNEDCKVCNYNLPEFCKYAHKDLQCSKN